MGRAIGEAGAVQFRTGRVHVCRTAIVKRPCEATEALSELPICGMGVLGEEKPQVL